MLEGNNKQKRLSAVVGVSVITLANLVLALRTPDAQDPSLLEPPISPRGTFVTDLQKERQIDPAGAAVRTTGSGMSVSCCGQPVHFAHALPRGDSLDPRAIVAWDEACDSINYQT
jgi:hypothetical protein